MTKANIRKRIARNINQLESDENTIADGIVTSTSINEAIDDIHDDELYPLFSDKFPDDFQQETYQRDTNTATGTVDATSSTTTLVTTTSMFTNDMVGLKIQNTTDSESTTIVAFTSGTTLTVADDIDDWSGDTIYVLGNEYVIGGEAADMKEIVDVWLKYNGTTDSYWTKCEKRDADDLLLIGNESFTQSAPVWYPKTLTTSGGVLNPGYGFLPVPTAYNGLHKFTYTSRPAAMTDSDEPRLKVPGISRTIIYGGTAQVLRQLELFDNAKEYQSLYEKSKQELISNYKPKTRGGATKVRYGSYINKIRSRAV